MNDLNALMRSMERDVNAAALGRAEFDGAGARRAVRRRRTVRAGAIASVAVLAAGGIAGAAFALAPRESGPVSVPTQTVTATPTPDATSSALPLPEPAIAGPCPSRASTMDAATAAEVASHPHTGETWLDEPEEIDAPDGGVQGEYWYLFGHRGDNEILGYESGMSSYTLAERSPSGDITWILRPMPTSADGPSWLEDALARFAYPSDNEQCYESLAFPDTIELIDGIVVDRPNAFDGLTTLAGTASQIASYGANEVIRYDDSAASYGESTGTTLPGHASTVTYAVLFAGGGITQVPFDPPTGADDIAGMSIVDYFDLACGVSWGPALWADDTMEADWTVIGSVRGRDVAVPTATNPYAHERYQAFVNLHGGPGEPARSYEQFLADHGIVGLRADDGGWWIGTNRDYSSRPGC